MKKPCKITFFLLTGLLLVPCQFISSQSTLIQKPDKEQQFVARVKQFSEFVDRFNYEKDFSGNLIDSSFSELYPRGKYISHLFDNDSFSESVSKSGLKKKFIDDVNNNHRYIYKYSQDIIAVAKTKISYNGNNEYITIFLSQEIVGDDMVKWVVMDVFGEVLNFMESDTSHIRFISPSSNETNFINLKRAMQDSLHLQDYAHLNYTYDPLSVFFYCLNKDIIEIDYVERLSYYIKAIPGWCFKVEEFNRPGYNSGWLISDLFECELELSEFLEYISLF